MDLQRLRGFLAVLKTGSFSEAAKLTYRLQPAVSRQIKSLEEELGARLFERFGPLKVKPTAEALLLKEIAEPLLRDFETIKKRWDERRGLADTEELRIAANEATIAYLLPDIIADLKKKYPRLIVSLKRSSKEAIVESILSGEADFGITSLDKAPAGALYQTFASYNRVAVLPKGHPLSTKKKNVSLKNISQYPLILPSADSRTRKIVDEAFKKARLDYNLFLEVMGRDSAKTYISKGLGISIMSEFYLREAEKKDFALIDLSKYLGKTTRGILYRKGKVLSPIQREFLGRMINV